MDPRLKSFGRRLLTGLLLVALFAWLSQRNAPAEEQVHTREFFSLGTLVTLTVHLDAGQSLRELETQLDTLTRTLAEYEHRWSQLGDGALAQVNARLAAGEAVSLPPELQPLLARAETLRQQTEGRFDPRIGRLVKLWQFDDQTRFRDTPPDNEALAAATADLSTAPSIQVQQPYGPAPGVQLDLGAIAKGDAARLIQQTLDGAGYPNHLINLGGDLLASGHRGDRPWHIAIRHPRSPGDSISLLARLVTDGREAVFTSGDYERLFLHDGTRYHHLLDPATGHPARALQSVTVITDDPVLADAACTALFVAGSDWRALAAQLELDQVLVVDAEGRLHATPRMAERITLVDGLQLEPLP